MANRLGITGLSLILGMVGLLVPAGVCQIHKQATQELKANVLHRAVEFYGAPAVAHALNVPVDEVTASRLSPSIVRRLRAVGTMEQGDVATGVVTYEAKDGTELDLDADPCHLEEKIFHKPFKKTALSETVKCGDKTHHKTQVEQQ